MVSKQSQREGLETMLERACLCGGKPPGHAASIPFGANVGTRPDVDPEPNSLGQGQKSSNIKVACEVICSRGGFVLVPGDVNL